VSQGLANATQSALTGIIGGSSGLGLGGYVDEPG